jgi:serine/threonine protein kinase
MPAQLGRYRFKKRLGGGGMGAVYLVENTELQRDEALKVPHFESGSDPSVRERFLREARAAAKLHHPNLCPIYHADVIDGIYFLTMCYLDGKPLSAYTGRPHPPREAVKIVAKLAQALEYAHGKGVIHRDLKPANIMLCPGTGPTVLDFGLAKQTKQPDQKLTQTGMAMGTPAYMPPEQVKGDLDAIGPASDIYSLGVILFELLTAHLPFQGSAAEVMAKALFAEPPLPSKLRPGLTAALDGICHKAMAKAPEDRYPSMKAFAVELAELLRTMPATVEANAVVSAKRETIEASDISRGPTLIPEQAQRSTQSPEKRRPTIPPVPPLPLQVPTTADDPKARKQSRNQREADSTVQNDALYPGRDWLKWVLPVAGLLLVVALGFTVYLVLPRKQDSRTTVNRSTGEREVEPVKETELDKGKAKRFEDGDKDKGKDKGSGTAGKDKVDDSEKDKTQEKDPTVVEPLAAPLKDRISAGNYAGGPSADQPSILVSRKASGDSWQRVSRGDLVYTADTLAALPGYAAVVGNSKTGVTVTLHGQAREFTLYAKQQYLGESAVVLHKNEQFDLDLTLLRGRLYLRNSKSKGDAKVRLRFQTEVWDLTLEEPGTELGVDHFQVYNGDNNYRADEEPYAEALLCLFQGKLSVKVDASKTYTLSADPPKEILIQWNRFTKAQVPQRVDKAPFYWDKGTPSLDAVPTSRRTEVREMTTALKNLQVRLSDKRKMIDVALHESLEKQENASRKLAVYCLGAIDDLTKVVEVLGDENPEHWIDRDAATWALRRWVSRGAGQGKLLYDPKTGSGALINMKFKKGEAKTIVELLHDVSPADWNKQETYEALSRCLAHRRVAIAQLGFFHLVQLTRGAKIPPGFNAAAPLEDRKRYSEQIDDMIVKKLLPPPTSNPEKKTTKKDEKDVSGKETIGKEAKDPPATEVWSGKSLNELLRSIQSLGALNRGPTIALDEDTLKHINLSAGARGNVGMLRDDGKLTWPLPLQEPQFSEVRDRLSKNIGHAVADLKGKKPVSAATLKEIISDFKALNDKLSDSANEMSPGQYIEAKLYLNRLSQAVKALSDPKAVNYFNNTWIAKGKNVAELVANMTKEGLVFAPATSGDEAAYSSLYKSLRAFEAGLPRLRE